MSYAAYWKTVDAEKENKTRASEKAKLSGRQSAVGRAECPGRRNTKDGDQEGPWGGPRGARVLKWMEWSRW